MAFWIPRELNRVSDYLSHVSTPLRSDAAGTFDADAAADLARTAAGVVDSSVIRTLARSTTRPCRRRGPSCRKFARQQPSGVRQVGGPLALPGRASSLCPAHPSPGGRRFQPVTAEDASTGTLPTTGGGIVRPVGPPPATNPTSPLRAQRFSPSGGAHLGAHDDLCDLRAGWPWQTGSRGPRHI